MAIARNKKNAIVKKSCTAKEDLLAREVALSEKTLAQCYLDAGYRDQGEKNRTVVHAVLGRLHVQQRVDYYRSMRASKLDVRTERVLAEVSSIAFLDPIDIFDVHDGVLNVRNLMDIPPWARRAISSIKQVTKHIGDQKEGVFETTLEVKFHNKPQALRMIAEFKNMFAENNKSLAPKVHLDLTFTGAR